MSRRKLHFKRLFGRPEVRDKTNKEKVIIWPSQCGGSLEALRVCLPMNMKERKRKLVDQWIRSGSI